MSSVNQMSVVISADTKNFTAGLRKATKAVRKSTSDIERNARQVQKWESQMTASNLAVGAGIALSARKVIDLTDAYTGMTNQLKMVTNNTEELEGVTASMFEVANNTRASVESTTALYAKMARATKNMGMEQEELVGLTSTINKAFAISGATTQEMTGSIRQLGQALASGALRGDEFNSVAEQAPTIMEAVKEATGKTAGELRELASEGKITSEILIESLNRYKEKIDSDFANSQKTFGQAMVIARNQAIEFVSANEDVISMVDKAGDAVIYLSENLDKLVIAGQALAILMTGKLVAGFVMNTRAKMADAVAMNMLTASTNRFVVAGKVSVTTMARMTAGLALLGGPVGILVTAGLAMATFIDWERLMGKESDATSDSIAFQISQMEKLSETDLATRLKVNADAEAMYRAELEKTQQAIKEANAQKAVGRSEQANKKNQIQALKEQEATLKGHIERTGKLRDEAQKEIDARADAEVESDKNKILRLQENKAKANAKMVEKLDERLLSEKEALEKRLMEEGKAIEAHAEEMLKQKGLTADEEAKIEQDKRDRMAKIVKEYEENISKIELDAKEKREAEAEKIKSDEEDRQAKIKAIEDQYKTESKLEDERYKAEQEAYLEALGIKEATTAEHMAVMEEMRLQHEENKADIDRGYSVSDDELFEQLASERDFLQARMDQELEMMQLAQERKVLEGDALERAQTDMERRHAQARANVVEAEMNAKFSTTRDVLGSMNTIAESMGKKGVKIQKAISLANAGMSIATGIAKANELGFPANIGEIARIVALGAKVMNSIKSANYGSSGTRVSGSGGGGARTVSAPTPQQAPQQAQASRIIDINFEGGGMFSSDQVRALIGQINEQVGDGLTINTGG